MSPHVADPARTSRPSTRRLAAALALVAAALVTIVVGVGTDELGTLDMAPTGPEPVGGTIEVAAPGATDELPATAATTPRPTTRASARASRDARRAAAPDGSTVATGAASAQPAGVARPVRTGPVATASPRDAGSAERAPAAQAAPAPPSGPRAASAPRRRNGPAAPTIAVFEVATARPTAGQPVAFRWSAGDDDGLLYGYEIDFGDGTVEQAVFATRCVDDPSDPTVERAPIEHVYETPGRYEVALTVASTGACGEGPLQRSRATTSANVDLLAVVPAPVELQVVAASTTV